MRENEEQTQREAEQLLQDEEAELRQRLDSLSNRNRFGNNPFD